VGQSGVGMGVRCVVVLSITGFDKLAELSSITGTVTGFVGYTVGLLVIGFELE